ncbi:hypothetical protein BJ138DRAFT_1118930 [Hygrophoropsis aurantiaca]|uniref:Uncharacterized protein n=1 Tax=Hygrophoropsis aurantiaca TaxID=72124 RepID=A0ACB7ZW41_9AGAM|nr:hypothetical protein BJ138DRAFT_1118930 [Hygrophoropsis aurantiaca]
MSIEEKRVLAELQGHVNQHDTEEPQLDSVLLDFEFDIENVLAGSEALEISHGGGEFEELTRELRGDFWMMNNAHKSRTRRHRGVDYRTRRDRVQRRVDAFNQQLDALTNAYMQWSLARGKNGVRGFFEERRCSPNIDLDINAGQTTIKVVDIFCTASTTLAILPTDTFVASALVRQGIIPCSPISPTVGITIDTIDFFRVARQRNPHFSIQAFVKTICDLQGVQFQRYLSRQFSIALDLFLQIRASVDKVVQETLQRQSPDWRLIHACPACTYTLKDEAKLVFKLLYAMDGNDSLKRVMRRSPGDEDDDDTTPAVSSELPNTQSVPGDRYLSREFVDQFANEVSGVTDMLESSNDDDENPCASRWKNMNDVQTQKMWGVFDESGVFMAVCRHGFSLVITDMVQSGELAKYPLAVVSKLLDTLGNDLGGGYDIGCKFKTTLNNSSLGPRVRAQNHHSLVPAFHGHAHRRLCQLAFLALYVKGLGLEDLETCERTFSKSNALASAVRYASSFHRKQAITLYFEHNDNYEVYSNLSKYFLDYALEILADGQDKLSRAMRELEITDERVFDNWLIDEKNYLASLQREPEEETLVMEYWQKLVKLAAHKKELDAVANVWLVSTPGTNSFGQPDVRNTAKTETVRRHALENYDNALAVVQVLEAKLEITRRWVPSDSEWQQAEKLVANRTYQRALDTLESLIVSRIFELTKMNRAGTGYKLRKHIGKALQTRSAAIRSALERYNKAAQAVSPPRRTLEWDEVVEYAFLADFDLLRDARQDISQRPWATPNARFAMDTYFKICRAKEEIERLDIEVRRVATYIWDEDRYLRACEDQARLPHPALAHQIAIHRTVRERFNAHHLHRLNEISILPGFTGSIIPGNSDRCGPGESASTPQIRIPPSLIADPPATQSGVGDHPTEADTLEDLDEEEDEEEEAEERGRALQDISQVLSNA